MENAYERSLKALKNDHWSIFWNAMVHGNLCWGMVYLTKKNGKYYREGEAFYAPSNPLCPSYDVFSEEISEGDTSEDIRRLIEADRKGQLAELVRQKNYLVLDSPHYDYGEIKSLRLPEPLLRLLMEQYLKEPIAIKQKAVEIPTLPQKKTEEKGASSQMEATACRNSQSDHGNVSSGTEQWSTFGEHWSIFLEAMVLEQKCWGMVYLTKKNGKYYREGKTTDSAQSGSAHHDAFSSEISEDNTSEDIRQIIEADRKGRLAELVSQKGYVMFDSPSYDFGELESLRIPKTLLKQIKKMYPKESAPIKQKAVEIPTLPQKKTEEKESPLNVLKTDSWSIFLDATVREGFCWRMVYLTKKKGKYYRECRVSGSLVLFPCYDAFSVEVSESNAPEDIRQIMEADRKGQLAELVRQKNYLMYDSPYYDFGYLYNLRVPPALFTRLDELCSYEWTRYIRNNENEAAPSTSKESALSKEKAEKIRWQMMPRLEAPLHDGQPPAPPTPAVPARTQDLSSFVFSGTVLEKYTNKNFSGEVRIPSFVTEIASDAFSGCDLTGVIIPPNCRDIQGFSGCKRLKNVKIISSDDGVWLRDRAFFDCKALEEVELPYLWNEGSSCFEGCTQLKKVTFHSKNRTVGNKMFKDCTALVSVKLPQDLHSIQKQAFSGCTALKEISLPNQLVKVARLAFENCTSLLQVNIPEKVKVVQSTTFSGCSRLRKVSIANGVGIIEDDAFRNCDIASVDLPPSVSNLGEKAFDSNTRINGYIERKILFPNAPKDILAYPVVENRAGPPIYYHLFEIAPLSDYASASAAINLRTGALHRIDIRYEEDKAVISRRESVSGLSFDCLPELGAHTRYKDMTAQNWKGFIPQDALDLAAENTLSERRVDDSFTSADAMGIDGLHLQLVREYEIKAFYFRKTQTGYRLYYGLATDPYRRSIFASASCHKETLLFDIFLAFEPDRFPFPRFTGADHEMDIVLSRDEFYSILNAAPNLFAGTFDSRWGRRGTARSSNISYTDEYMDVFCWKDGKACPCADHPETIKAYNALDSLVQGHRLERCIPYSTGCCTPNHQPV